MEQKIVDLPGNKQKLIVKYEKKNEKDVLTIIHLIEILTGQVNGTMGFILPGEDVKKQKAYWCKSIQKKIHSIVRYNLGTADVVNIN